MPGIVEKTDLVIVMKGLMYSTFMGDSLPCHEYGAPEVLRNFSETKQNSEGYAPVTTHATVLTWSVE